MMRTAETTIFMCGDVMTGRGIDQILPYPGDPQLFEYYVHDARRYVRIAEDANGHIRRPVDFSYIWGDALAILEQMDPDVRIINLETSITTSNDYWKGKGINYRMHPDNAACLAVAGVDICSLTNNHVLDWGYAGLVETLHVLKEAKIKGAGAGMNILEARAPAIVETVGKGRTIVFSFGAETSGIPEEWAASADAPGVNLLHDLSDRTMRFIESQINEAKHPGDIVICSIHWGSNWEYRIGRAERAFAHRLIKAGADIIHGHSSHHVRGIEVYAGKPIIYGCGDFINDYEGIGGFEAYRGDLGLMYFVQLDPMSGNFIGLRMKPTRVRNLRVNRASPSEALWLRDTLNREGERLGTWVELSGDGTLVLHWR